jgi:hypothetical protein
MLVRDETVFAKSYNLLYGLNSRSAALSSQCASFVFLLLLLLLILLLLLLLLLLSTTTTTTTTTIAVGWWRVTGGRKVARDWR